MSNIKNIVYRYRLTKEHVHNNHQVCGINLTKEWSDFKSIKDQLNPFLKTSINPDGFIDFEKKDYNSNEVIQQSTYTGNTPDIIAKETLHAMDRKELVPIAKYYRIDITNKPKEILIKAILEYQEKREKAEAEQKKIADEIEAEQKEAIKEAEKQMLNQQGEVIVNENNGFFGFGSKKS